MTLFSSVKVLRFVHPPLTTTIQIRITLWDNVCWRTIHSVVHMKSNKSSCVTNENREFDREVQSPPNFTSPHSSPVNLWSGHDWKVVSDTIRHSQIALRWSISLQKHFVPKWDMSNTAGQIAITFKHTEALAKCSFHILLIWTGT